MLVSIIIPIYNVDLEKFQKCMSSICNQTLRDIEIILVDDCGSIRETVNYAYGLQKEDKRIVIIHNEVNMGGGGSRDRGIEYARGEYLAFCDADDWVDLDFYEKLYKKTKDIKYDVVKGELYGASAEINNRIRNAMQYGKPLYDVFRCQHTTAIYRTAFIKENKIGYGKTRISQDVTFVLKVATFAQTMETVEGVYYYYERDNTNSLTHTNIAKNIAHYCAAIQERMEFLVEHADYNEPAFMRYIEFNTNRFMIRADMVVECEFSSDVYDVSFIVAIHNHENSLNQIIDCLQKQTLANIEFLFIDDGSTDKSANIIKQKMSSDNRISYYYTDNKGMGVAFNTGIKQAKGKYVICIDPLGYYKDDYAEKMYAVAENVDAEVVICNYTVDNGVSIEKVTADKIPIEHLVKGLDVIDVGSSFYSCFCNKLISRKYLQKNEIRFAPTKIASGTLFSYTTLLLAKKIYVFPDELLKLQNNRMSEEIIEYKMENAIECVDVVMLLLEYIQKKKLFNSNLSLLFIDIFFEITLDNCQYGFSDGFMDACIDFIHKVFYDFDNLTTLLEKYNSVSLYEAETKYLELDLAPENQILKKLIKNKMDFIAGIKSYLEKLRREMLNNLIENEKKIQEEKIKQLRNELKYSKQDIKYELGKIFVENLHPRRNILSIPAKLKNAFAEYNEGSESNQIEICANEDLSSYSERLRVYQKKLKYYCSLGEQNIYFSFGNVLYDTIQNPYKFFILPFRLLAVKKHRVKG